MTSRFRRALGGRLFSEPVDQGYAYQNAPLSHNVHERGSALHRILERRTKFRNWFKNRSTAKAVDISDRVYGLVPLQVKEAQRELRILQATDVRVHIDCYEDNVVTFIAGRLR